MEDFEYDPRDKPGYLNGERAVRIPAKNLGTAAMSETKAARPIVPAGSIDIYDPASS